MTDLPTAWTAHADAFSAVVETVTDWDAPSPCEGWTAADVLEHVMQTQREFVARHGREVPAFEGVPQEAWLRHQAAMAALVADGDFTTQPMETPLGTSSVGRSLMQFYGFDMIIHRWDIARSQGRDERLSEGELDEVEAAVEGFGEHAYAPGIFQDPVPVPDDAPRQARVLGRTGRRA